MLFHRQHLEIDFDTSSAVHLRSSSRHSPDGFIPPFPRALTTPAIVPEQPAVVWTLILQSEPEGPTLISCAAELLKGGLLHSQPPLRAGRGALSPSSVQLVSAWASTSASGNSALIRSAISRQIVCAWSSGSSRLT